MQNIKPKNKNTNTETRQPALIFATSQPNATFCGVRTRGYDPHIRTRPRFLYSAPSPQVSSLRSLESVLNAAARLVLKLRKFERVSISTITRNEPHWLPVDQRIIYKLCLLAYKCQHEQAPSYSSSLCAPLSAATTRRHLRAATQGDLDFPRTRTVTYGSRAFAVSGPMCWNALPPSLKSPLLKLAQHSLLKTTLMAQQS